MKKINLLICFFLLCSCLSFAQTGEKSIEVYGFVMTDAGYQLKTNDPAWFDVIRTTKLPAFQGQFEPDGRTYWSVRQTRFGVRSTIPTKVGTIKTIFEFELFGTGVDAGQTTLRLRHAYGEIGKFGAGQYWSPFMDIDVFPNSLEYWGPPGMVFFRNIQIRYMPVIGKTNVTFALERPGASADGGVYADRIELQDIRPQFYLPDLSGHVKHTGDWGYVQLAGIVRSIKWRDIRGDTLSLDGSAVGWGGSLTSNINITKNDVLRLAAVYGRGIENYMNDAPADVGIDTNFEGRTSQRPIKGVPLPLWSGVAFLDHNWSKYFSTSIGYSMIEIDNSEGQGPTAFKKGQYALGNLLYYPWDNVMAGVEFQWGERLNKVHFISKDMRVQFSFRYKFSRLFNWQ